MRSSIKSEDVIPVEPEMARSLRAKFEKWATDVERDNNNKNHNGAYDLPNDYTPQMDTAKNLKAKFESFRCDASSKPLIEKRKPRVNRFVVSPVSRLQLLPIPCPFCSYCSVTDTQQTNPNSCCVCRRCPSILLWLMLRCARLGCR